MDNKEPKPSTASSSPNISKLSISIDKKNQNHERPNNQKKNTEQLITKQVMINSWCFSSFILFCVGKKFNEVCFILGSIEKSLQVTYKDLLQQTYGDIEALYFTFRNTIVIFKDKISAEKAIQNRFFFFQNKRYIVNKMYYLFEPRG